MAVSPCLTGVEKKHWWLSSRKVVDKYIKDARNLISSQDQDDVASAVTLLDAALALSPRYEVALELKARSLLYLRRYKEVADMLQDYIPSLRMSSEESGAVSSESSSTLLSRERVKLLGDSFSESSGRDAVFKCFSVSDLKKKVMAGLCKNCEKEGHWRYLVLGQACCRLGLIEDGMVLLQTGKRLASAAFRRESISLSDDSFTHLSVPQSSPGSVHAGAPHAALTELESVTHLLSHIKLLLRRRAAALAALDVGLYSESIRHFSKIVDGRRGAPEGFLAECYMLRALAYKSSGRIAESISDCNKTLALEPSCIQALETRASLFESIRCYADSLHDLEHLKLLYNTILRDRKLPGPPWKRHNVRYREIPGKLCSLTTKTQQLKQKISYGETGNVDYYGLIGIRRGCSRSELDRAHLLLCLKHKPEKAISFIDRCEFACDKDIDSIKDRAKMSALLLYRLIQKGYSNVMADIVEEEAAEKQRKAAAALQAAQAAIQIPESQDSHVSGQSPVQSSDNCVANMATNSSENKGSATSGSSPNAFQGVFCRDLAAVGSLLSRSRYSNPIPINYEALSC